MQNITPNELNVKGLDGLKEWFAMVAQHSAKHYQAGWSMEKAIELGMRDYTTQLNRLAEGIQDRKDGFATTDSKFARDSVAMVSEMAYSHITKAVAA